MKTVTSPFMSLPSSNPWVEKSLNSSAGPLSGLRLAVKDLFHMKGLPTSAGNPDWLATHPIADATSPVVTRLIDAGAKFCGKTITDELAYSLNGQNIHYGMPENPVTPNRLPGGSSSGSAVAVAKGLADIGLGTDTGGSIRIPASYQGLYGLRPTHGIIDVANMVPLAPSFDTVGFMTRDLDTLERVTNTLIPLPSAVIDTAKLACIDNLIKSSAHGDLITHYIKQLPQPAANVSIDTQYLETAETFRVLQGAEIILQHGGWLREVKPCIATDIQARIDASFTISDSDIQQAKHKQQELIIALEQLFEQHTVLIMPTTPGLSPPIGIHGKALAEYRRQLLAITAIAGLTGCPQLHLPLFTFDGAPCGISLLGPRNSDLALIRLAQKLGKNHDGK